MRVLERSATDETKISPADEEAEVSSTTNENVGTNRDTNTAAVGPTTRHKVQRSKANARERTRMHGLNAALDTLRRHVPFARGYNKLSKIETLRMARNYIYVLSQSLLVGRAFEASSYGCAMSRGLSQATANQISTALNLRPRTVKLLPPLELFQQPTYVAASSTSADLATADHVTPERSRGSEQVLTHQIGDDGLRGAWIPDTEMSFSAENSLNF